MSVFCPIDAIIIDTSAFYNEQFDFIGAQDSILPSLFEVIKEKKITLISHPILRAEIKKHIADSEVISKLSHFKAAIKKYKSALELIGLSAEEITGRVDALNMQTKLTEAFEKIFEEANELPYPNAEDVFAQYFACEAPFAASGDKKSEFPDAFVLLAIKQYLKANPTKSMLILTDDGDWHNALSDTPRAILANSVGEGMRMIQDSEDILPIFKDVLPKIESALFSALECEAYELNGFEMEDDLEITAVRVKDISDLFIPLKITNDRVILRTTAEIEVDGNAIVMDEDRSIWDHEDRAYIFTAYSSVDFEKATAEVEFDVEISFDPENHLSFITLEEVKPNIRYNIEVDLDYDHAIFYDVETTDGDAEMLEALEEYYRH